MREESAVGGDTYRPARPQDDDGGQQLTNSMHLSIHGCMLLVESNRSPVGSHRNGKRREGAAAGQLGKHGHLTSCEALI